MRRLVYIFFSCLVILFSSCNGKINIVENADGTKTVSGSLGFSKSAAEELSAIVGALDDTAGLRPADAPLISEKEIVAFLTSMGGKNVTASVKSNNSYSFSAVMPKDFEITTEKCLELYGKLDEESQMYADLLMAPIFTGEKIAVDEYEQLLASVYGASFAKELVSGKIEFSGTTKKVVTAGQFFCGVSN